MLVSSAKSKHSASLMKNQLLDKIIFSVRYLEIWLYTIFFKKISRKQEVLKLLCNFQSRMIVIRERPAWSLTFSCVVRIFSFRSLYFMFSLVMGFFFSKQKQNSLTKTGRKIPLKVFIYFTYSKCMSSTFSHSGRVEGLNGV